MSTSQTSGSDDDWDDRYPKDGGSAFPSRTVAGSYNYPGMSLRDWYIGQALAGVLGSGLVHGDPQDAVDAVEFAEHIADMVIDRRKKWLSKGSK